MKLPAHVTARRSRQILLSSFGCSLHRGVIAHVASWRRPPRRRGMILADFAQRFFASPRGTMRARVLQNAPPWSGPGRCRRSGKSPAPQHVLLEHAPRLIRNPVRRYEKQARFCASASRGSYFAGTFNRQSARIRGETGERFANSRGASGHRYIQFFCRFLCEGISAIQGRSLLESAGPWLRRTPWRRAGSREIPRSIRLAAFAPARSAFPGGSQREQNLREGLKVAPVSGFSHLLHAEFFVAVHSTNHRSARYLRRAADDVVRGTQGHVASLHPAV